MNLLLREIFLDTISRARQVGIWEKMTIEQKETLVSRCLLLHFNNSGKQQERVKNTSPSRQGVAGRRRYGIEADQASEFLLRGEYS